MGKLKFKGFSLGSAGILIIALIAGHYGIRLPEIIEFTGLIFFIFSIGIQAGPGFIEAVKSYEVRLWLLPSILTTILAFLFSLGICYGLGLSYESAIGFYASLLTNTASLAAGLEVLNSTQASLAYSICYPISMFIMIIFVKILPLIFKIDFKHEESEFQINLNKRYPKVTSACFKVLNPKIVGKTIEDLNSFESLGGSIARIKQEGNIFIPNESTVIHENNILMIVGDDECLNRYEILLGEKTGERLELSKQNTYRWLRVNSKRVVNKRLKVLNLDKSFQGKIHSMWRSGIEFVPNAGTRLRYGDKILVEVSKDAFDKLSNYMGEDQNDEFDFLPIAAAIIIGVFIGSFKFTLGNGPQIGPGMTGGILIATLVLGRIGKTGPLLWNIAGNTNYFLRQLGILLFLTGVGTRNGSTILDAFETSGINIVLVYSLAAVLLYSIVTFFIFKQVKTNKLTGMGVLAASMTSAPSLQVINEMHESSIPNMSYSTLYPFSLFFTIIFAQILVAVISYLLI